MSARLIPITLTALGLVLSFQWSMGVFSASSDQKSENRELRHGDSLPLTSLGLQITPSHQTIPNDSPATFTITVRNVGDDVLTNIQLMATVAECSLETDISLNPGEFTGHICQTDSLSGDLTNHVVAKAITANDQDVQAGVVATVDVIAPEISVALAPTTQMVLSDSPITFTVHITNSGNFPLDFVVASDAKLPDCNLNEEQALEIGEALSYPCHMISTTSDFSHRIVAEGSPPVGPFVSAVATATVDVIAPAIAVEIASTEQSAPRDTTINFTVQATNIGDVTLHDIVVVSPQLPNCDLGTLSTLAPNKLTGYTCSTNTGNVDFSAEIVVTATTPIQTHIHARDEAHVDVIAPALQAIATPTEQTVTTGSTAIFSFTASNPGNYTLRDVTMADVSDTNGSVGIERVQCDFPVPFSLTASTTHTISCTTENVTEQFSSTLQITAHTISGETIQGQMVDHEVLTERVTVELDAFPFAAVGDRVWDDLDGNGIQDVGEPGLAGVTVVSRQPNSGTVLSTTTDSQGNYLFGKVRPGTIQIEVIPPVGYRFSPQDQGDDRTLDSDVDPTTQKMPTFDAESLAVLSDLDAGLYLPPLLEGEVWYDSNLDGVQDVGEVGEFGVAVRLHAQTGIALSTTTALDGHYLFDGLNPDQYFVEFVLPDNRTRFSPAHQDSVPDPQTGRTEPMIMHSGDKRSEVDVGIYRLPVVQGEVWEDSNLDGLQSENEVKLQDVTVRLYSEQHELVGITRSNDQGRYFFSNIDMGRYYIEFERPEYYVFASLPQQGSDATLDSDVTPEGNTQWFDLTDSTFLTHLDAAAFNIDGNREAVLNLAAIPLQNAVQLWWVANSNPDLAGYRIWRSTTDQRDSASVLSGTTLLPVKPQKFLYLYFDTTLIVQGQTANPTYFYWIEVIYSDQSRREYGPVSGGVNSNLEQSIRQLFLPLIAVQR